VQSRFSVEILSGKPQIEREGLPIRVWIFRRSACPERVRIPAPDYTIG
jgi:hypothetical protein